MKDYLQPAATTLLALAIGSLGFTLPTALRAYGDFVTVGGTVQVEIPGYVYVKQ